MEIYVVILTLIGLMKKVYGEWVKSFFGLGANDKK